MRALIVDDEEDICLMTKLILKKAGVDADDSNRIQDARKKIAKNNYNFFLLDLNLPDGSGFDLIPLIKEKYEDADIVIISAYDSPAEKQTAHEFGITKFIKKPFSKQDIFKAVDKLLNN